LLCDLRYDAGKLARGGEAARRRGGEAARRRGGEAARRRGGEAVEDLVGALVPDEGLGSSFQLVIQLRIEATNSQTERWLPRLIHFVVSSAGQRSTRLSQEL